MISSNAISAAPRLPTSATNGRLIAPPPELSWRTRREIRLTRTLGLPTFSNAFLVSSAFKAFKVFKVERGKIAADGPKAIEKYAMRMLQKSPFPKRNQMPASPENLDFSGRGGFDLERFFDARITA